MDYLCRTRFKDRLIRILATAAQILAITILMFGFIATAKAEMLSLEQAVSRVVEANPSLASIQARSHALAALPDQAATLPDPRLSVNLVNMPLDSFSFTQEPMTQFQLGISQTLPYPGKLALRSQSAQQEAEAAEADVAEKRLQLVRDVKTLWWNLFYIDRALETISKNKSLLAQFVSIAETRYEVGQGQQQDVLLANVELSKLQDNNINLLNLQKNEIIRLNLLLDQPANHAILLTDQVSEKLQTLPDESVLIQRAREKRPFLSAQQRRTEAAHSRRELAEKDYSPDFAVGAVYGLRNGTNLDGSSRADFGSIMFSMNLPLYSGSKQDRAVDQRNAEWAQQKYQLHEHRNQVDAEVSRAISDYRRAGEQMLLFQQEIIPQARQTVDSMLAGYQVGKVDFISLVSIQTTLYNYETQYWKALSIANQALARLVAAIGEENVHE